jgi:hypothetical protein
MYKKTMTGIMRLENAKNPIATALFLVRAQF